MQLPLTNVINISVSTAQTGVGEYNVNNLALFSHDTYGSTFGTLGYAIYLSPQQVATDFGTNSETYSLANQVFSQQPNILAGNGYLVVIPVLPETQTLTFSGGTPALGSFSLVYGSQSVVVTATETAGSLQAALQALNGLSQVQVTNNVNSGSPVQLTFYGVYNPLTVSTTGNTLETAGSGSITIAVAISGSHETLAAAITRTEGLVQYFGITTDNTVDVMGSTDVLAAAAVVQPLNKMMLLGGDLVGDISPGGTLDLIRANGYTQTRALYYGGNSDTNALAFVAAYAGRALSTNFDGNNTTETMHLKNLVGVEADNSLTQTLLNEAVAAGADTYPSLQGVAKVFTSGENTFFDSVYNLQWFVGALQVAGFNYLAETQTKIPQTEQGMTGLKGAYRAVCQQGVVNQYLAPGQWNSATTFGNQLDFLSNISNIGYYIYSTPVSQQSQNARAARQAPLIQIAVKESGAVQSSDVIVYVNA
jgi:hypothetical protein